jgi:UDP-3-O-[3-hydroxymyristoyl] glucosamine N-acyltransferase
VQSLESLAQVADAQIVGEKNTLIHGVADLVTAGPRDISFLSHIKYMSDFNETRAGAVLVSEEIEPRPTTLLVCKDPYLGFAQIAGQFFNGTLGAARDKAASTELGKPSIHPDAVVSEQAFVGRGAHIGEGCVLMPGSYVGAQAKLGPYSILHPGARVLNRCELGSFVVIHAGAVIGADGFGYAVDAKGRRYKIPQLGIVVLGDDVEIGANTTIDRATFGKTRVARGCKIDNLVQIAHNVVLGEDVVIASQSGIAGSTEVGDRVVIGAQAGVTGHIRIASDVILAARTGVTKSILKAGIYAGLPAQPHRKWLKQKSLEKNLLNMQKKMRHLESIIQDGRIIF